MISLEHLVSPLVSSPDSLLEYNHKFVSVKQIPDLPTNFDTSKDPIKLNLFSSDDEKVNTLI